MAEPVDLGWVAGVLDVRGYLSERPSSSERRLPTVAVTMSDRDGAPHPVVARLCAMTGVEPVGTGKGFNRTSCGEHCPEPHQHVTSRYHRWSVGGAKAATVLAAVAPRLSDPALRAEAARLLTLADEARLKGAHVAQMTRLGWPARTTT